MSLLDQRVEAFDKLSSFLCRIDKNKIEYIKFFKIIKKSNDLNKWFTEENILSAIKIWGKSLTKKNLSKWLTNYNLINTKVKRIGLILAGNIPLVGFHDILCVLLTGNKAVVKCSSKDHLLLPYICKKLVEFDLIFKNKFVFKDKIKNFDALIATGNNTSTKYFDFYFSKYPKIIRKHRNGIAILTGNESSNSLNELAKDIFLYFGLGCRSVSKIYIPINYSFDKLIDAIKKYSKLKYLEKYSNNYNYNKAIYLMNNTKFKDLDFFILKEDFNIFSPVGTLHYEYYDDINTLRMKLNLEKDKIQCITSNSKKIGGLKLGRAQSPNLWDYPDDIDTLSFLINL
tara:strand:+ start:137757 stop:138782 length:1026 start_codon:yes stop_codon:yes gene_type:complete